MQQPAGLPPGAPLPPQMAQQQAAAAAAQQQQQAAAAAAAAAQQQQAAGGAAAGAAGAAAAPAKASAMDQLLQYKQQLETDLVRVEAQIADMELKFLNAEHGATASVIKGFDAHLSSKEALRKRMQRSWKTEDRWFSLSSTSSPVVRRRPFSTFCHALLAAHLPAAACLLLALPAAVAPAPSLRPLCCPHNLLRPHKHNTHTTNIHSTDAGADRAAGGGAGHDGRLWQEGVPAGQRRLRAEGQAVRRWW